MNWIIGIILWIGFIWFVCRFFAFSKSCDEDIEEMMHEKKSDTTIKGKQERQRHGR